MSISLPGGFFGTPAFVEEDNDFARAFSDATKTDISAFTDTYREMLCKQALDADGSLQERYQKCLNQLQYSNLLPVELEYLNNTSQKQPPADRQETVSNVNYRDVRENHLDDDNASRATTTETYMNLPLHNQQILSHQKKILKNFYENIHNSSPPSHGNQRQTPRTPTHPPRSVPPSLATADQALSLLTSVLPSPLASPASRRAASYASRLHGAVTSAQHRRQGHHDDRQPQSQPQPQSQSQVNQDRLRELGVEHETILQQYSNFARQMLDMDLRLHQIQREMSFLGFTEGSFD